MKKLILIGFVCCCTHSSFPGKKEKNTRPVYYNTKERKYDDNEIIGASTKIR